MRKTTKPTGNDSEADKFRDLARKLVAVPKKEVDERMAEYERKKEKRPTNK